MTDGSQLKTQDAVRAVIGASHPLVSAKIKPQLDDMAQAFIRRSPLVMLSTASKDGLPDVSPRGDDPGFVIIHDAQTLYLPDRPGNKLIYSLQNIIENPHVGLLFLIPGVRESYRVHGTARVVNEPALLERLAARGKPALLAIEISVTKAFLHCGKALIRSQAWTAGADGAPSAFTFGAVIAEGAGGDAAMAAQVDALVADDYENNL